MSWNVSLQLANKTNITESRDQTFLNDLIVDGTIYNPSGHPISTNENIEQVLTNGNDANTLDITNVGDYGGSTLTLTSDANIGGNIDNSGPGFTNKVVTNHLAILETGSASDFNSGYSMLIDTSGASNSASIALRNSTAGTASYIDFLMGNSTGIDPSTPDYRIGLVSGRAYTTFYCEDSTGSTASIAVNNIQYYPTGYGGTAPAVCNFFNQYPNANCPQYACMNLPVLMGAASTVYPNDPSKVIVYGAQSFIKSADPSAIINKAILSSSNTTSMLRTTNTNTGSLTVAGYDSDALASQGDLLIGNSNDAFTRLPIGTANQILVSDGTTMSWNDPPNVNLTLSDVLTNGNDAGGDSISNVGNYISSSYSGTFQVGNTGGVGDTQILGYVGGISTYIDLTSTDISLHPNTGGVVSTTSDLNVSGNITSTGSIQGTDLYLTDVSNAGDALSSSTAMSKFKLAAGYRDSSNWMYFSGLDSGGSTITYGRIDMVKAYFATLQHPIRVNNSLNLTNSHNGVLMESVGNYMNKPNLNDAHVQGDVCRNEKSKKWYGVLSEYEFPVSNINSEDEQQYNILIPNKTNESSIKYVNAGGEGMLYVCDIGGNISNGDYICSSNIAGLCMKQDDDLRHSYTVAKAVIDCDFTENDSYNYPMYEVNDDEEKTRNWNEDKTDFKYNVLSDKKIHLKYVKVFNDHYTMYNDEQMNDELFSIQHDFSNSGLVGQTYKACLLGVLYQG